MLLRYQNYAGRGPYQPGLSESWVSATRDFSLPPLQEDFPDFKPIVDAAFRRGLHIGTAIRGKEKLHEWFTHPERVRLGLLGFYVVDASDCEVLGETQWQVIIGSKMPLFELPKWREE